MYVSNTGTRSVRPCEAASFLKLEMLYGTRSQRRREAGAGGEGPWRPGQDPKSWGSRELEVGSSLIFQYLTHGKRQITPQVGAAHTGVKRLRR